MNKKLTKEEFISRSKSFPRIEKINIDYIYQVYDLAFDGIIALSNSFSDLSCMIA